MGSAEYVSKPNGQALLATHDVLLPFGSKSQKLLPKRLVIEPNRSVLEQYSCQNVSVGL